MNPIVFIALSAAGGAGAGLRLLVDGLIRSRVKTAYPVGTTVINISGSLVLGALIAFTLHGASAPSWALILGTGLIGGFTTFSTASFETVRLVQERKYATAVGNGLGMLVGAVLAALLGLWIGSLL